MKRGALLFSFVFILGLLSFVSASGLDEFPGVTEVKKVTSSHPNYNEISQQYSLTASELYEVTYHIKEGWNFLPYPILNGRDSVTGKASCWKQDDQRGNIQATVLDYVYMYEPDMSVLPESHEGYYIGGATEEWDNDPLSDYKDSIWGIAEPNKQMTLPINWVYSPQDCDFLFYSRWIDEQNYEETSQALQDGSIPCTADYCPLKLEKGWQVVLQLFPGFTWNEIKGDCVIEEINFWYPDQQQYVVGANEKQENLEIFMDTKIEKEDYFKPVLMKVKNTCTIGFNTITPPTTSSCENLLDSGSSDSKVDIVFISDKYTDADSWIQDVDSFVDLDGNNDGFFSVEPMKSNKNKFNVWRNDELNNDFYDIENLMLHNPTVMDFAKSCGNVDLVFLVLDNTDYPDFQGGSGGNDLAMITRYRSGELNVRSLAHEFGHAFVNLGDEYENSVQIFDYTERPNIDSEGCPKWCSGELNEGASCYDEYIEFRTCLYNATNDLTGSYDEECSYNWNLPNCDLGKDCRAETGCYWNAKSLISFRSSEKSIMKHPEEDPFEYNVISQEEILNKINSITT